MRYLIFLLAFTGAYGQESHRFPAYVMTIGADSTVKCDSMVVRFTFAEDQFILETEQMNKVVIKNIRENYLIVEPGDPQWIGTDSYSGKLTLIGFWNMEGGFILMIIPVDPSLALYNKKYVVSNSNICK